MKQGSDPRINRTHRPPELDVLAILPVGYPTQAVAQGKNQRKPLPEVAHHERFGQLFP